MKRVEMKNDSEFSTFFTRRIDNAYAAGIASPTEMIVAVTDAARRKEIGTVIMHGAAKTAADKWEGDLLDVDSGKTYSGVVTLESPTALNLKGCVLVICRGETWKKVR